MPDNRLPTNQSQLDIADKLQAIATAIINKVASAVGVTFDDTNVSYTANNVQSAIESASTAAGTEYLNGVSVADTLNGEQLTGLTSSVIDISKVSAYRVGKLIIVSINDASVTSNVGTFEVIFSGLPNARMRILGSLTILSGSTVVANTNIYTIVNAGQFRTMSALSNGQTITGSIIYLST